VESKHDITHQQFIRRLLAYFAQAFCENASFFLVALETAKLRDFVGETQVKVLEEVEKTFYPNVLVVKQGIYNG
jgi:hypothetical protein